MMIRLQSGGTKREIVEERRPLRLDETPALPAGAEESICSFSPDSDQHNKPTNASTCVKLLRKESAKCFVHTHDLPSHIVFLAACLALVAARSSLSHSLA